MSQHGLKSGTPLGESTYRIDKVLGQGSFGITYLATARFTVQGRLGNMELETKVAVKEFFMKDVNRRKEDGISVGGAGGSVFSGYRKKFKKEAENLAKLSHRGIVKVFDVFDANNTTYYVMQFLDGQNLDDFIEEAGSLSEQESVRIVSEIGDAVSYMHSTKMLHLDIKPKNIMRKSDGTYHLIDFGLSKQLSDDEEGQSSSSIGLGTPGYAPIEQAGYKRDGSFPATLDVYALGATMYKMLTGKCPPEATSVINDGFPEKDLIAKGVSHNTLVVLKKAMAPLRKERYQSVEVFIKELVGGITEPENTDVDRAEAAKADAGITIVDSKSKPKRKPKPISSLQHKLKAEPAPDPAPKKNRKWTI